MSSLQLMRPRISGEVSTSCPGCSPWDFLKAENLVKPMNCLPRGSKAEALAVVKATQVASSRPVFGHPPFLIRADLQADLVEGALRISSERVALLLIRRLARWLF